MDRRRSLLNAHRPIKKLQRSNLSEEAYQTLKELLLGGKRYAPGGKISVEKLSRDLGVSRTPIWGAINRLEAEGVVHIVPRQGVYLLDFDLVLAQEIYVVREALEGVAARLAAVSATERDLDQIRASLRCQQTCLDRSDVEGYAAAALLFHQQIVTASGNRTLRRLLDSVYAQIEAMRARMKYLPTKLPDSFQDHDKILHALEARDPEAAEDQARKHINVLTREIAMSVADAPTARS
jgi:DNA-binding GntR family transcriptional regulator